MKYKSHQLINRLGYWVPSMAVMAIIFSLSSFSTLPSPQVFAYDFFVKKVAHMFVFGLLFFTYALAINQGKEKRSWSFWLAFVFTFLYAVLDELHQSTTPGRHPQVTDVGYDVLGAYISFIWLKGLLI
jgi:VanZ family protein